MDMNVKTRLMRAKQLPFSFALDVSLASSLRPDPSDTNEAR